MALAEVLPDVVSPAAEIFAQFRALFFAGCAFELPVASAVAVRPYASSPAMIAAVLAATNFVLAPTASPAPVAPASALRANADGDSMASTVFRICAKGLRAMVAAPALVARASAVGSHATCFSMATAILRVTLPVLACVTSPRVITDALAIALHTGRRPSAVAIRSVTILERAIVASELVVTVACARRRYSRCLTMVVAVYAGAWACRGSGRRKTHLLIVFATASVLLALLVTLAAGSCNVVVATASDLAFSVAGVIIVVAT